MVKQHIFLVGMPGCGKTSIAKKLARKLSCNWIDLDEQICHTTSLSIAQFFEKFGEEKFRELERDTLHIIGKIDPCIVATGGGTPAFYDNMNYINSCGVSVYLEANEKFLLDRLSTKTNERPMFSGLSHEKIQIKISKILAERERFYKQAKYTFKLPVKDLENLIFNELKKDSCI